MSELKLTQALLKAKAADPAQITEALTKAYIKVNYRTYRKKAFLKKFPTSESQFEMIYDDIDVWREVNTEIKARYPKPSIEDKEVVANIGWKKPIIYATVITEDLEEAPMEDLEPQG